MILPHVAAPCHRLTSLSRDLTERGTTALPHVVMEHSRECSLGFPRARRLALRRPLGSPRGTGSCCAAAAQAVRGGCWEAQDQGRTRVSPLRFLTTLGWQRCKRATLPGDTGLNTEAQESGCAAGCFRIQVSVDRKGVVQPTRRDFCLFFASSIFPLQFETLFWEAEADNPQLQGGMGAGGSQEVTHGVR